VKSAADHTDVIFWEAAQLAPGPGRDAYLTRSCGEDRELRARVDKLLRVQPKVDGFLEKPFAGPAATADLRAICEGPGSVIGPYKLLEQIGEGGMGLVFVAEQERPVKRRVALKIIKPGMDSRQVVARFEAERQALALMDHPNIAKVIDAGTTDAGRPYFVMELVQGIPITEYCDQARLTVRQRIEVFVQVCRAVQHAHNKGVIHRDLKPSNILVAVHDVMPVVKVIDFGVAKAVGHQLAMGTPCTDFAQMVGTPAYMSPEQAGLSSLDMDTRSDIYALGVLLYELLIGTTPFPGATLHKAGLDEMRRMIREDEPPRPSSRLAMLEEGTLSAVAEQRAVETGKLRRQVRGELDWVVMKCLEKDRNQRYETANALAADAQRYLDDLPVLASQPSAVYRLRKFGRRNKGTLTVTGLVMAFVLILGGGAGWAAWDRTARQLVVRGTVGQALEQSAAYQQQGNWPQALAEIRRAEAALAAQPADDDLEQRMRQRMADLVMVSRLEEVRLKPADATKPDLAAADPAYAQAFKDYGIDVLKLEPKEVAQRIKATRIAPELAAALQDWALVCKKTRPSGDTGWKDLLALARAADPDEWRNRLRDALERGDQKTLKELAASAQGAGLPPAGLVLLGKTLVETNAPQEAEALLRKAQRQHPADFWINRELAYALTKLKPPQWTEAIRFFTASLALRPHSPGAHLSLGWALAKQDRLEEAKPEFLKAIELDPKVAVAHNNVGLLLFYQGHLEKAKAELLKAIQLDPKDALAHTNLGMVLDHQGWLEEAKAEHLKAIELDPKYETAHSNLGVVLGRQGRLEEAKAELLRAIELNPEDAMPHGALGSVLIDQGRLEEAKAELLKALELDPKLAAAHGGLGAVLSKQGRLAEAKAELLKALELDPKLFVAHEYLGAVLFNQGRLEEAKAECLKAIELDPKCCAPHNTLGAVLFNQGRVEEAKAVLLKAIELGPKEAGAHDNLGDILAHQGQLEEARAEYLKAIELDSKNVLAHKHLGYLLQRQGRLEEATAVYLKVIKLDPKDAIAHDNLGIVLFNQGRLEEAKAQYLKAIELDPKRAVAHDHLGAVLFRQGRLEEAKAEYLKAMDLDPKDAIAHYRLGILLERQGRLEEAKAEYHKALELDPKDAIAHERLGILLERQGRMGEAKAEYLKAIKLDSKNANAHNNLSWLLATCQDLKLRDPALAVQMAKTAVDLTPKNGSFWNTLGVAYYRAGSWQEALAALDKSVALRKGGSAEDWLFLAMAHWQLGDKAAARKWYDQAVRWMDKNQSKNEQLRRFQAEAAELLGVQEPGPTVGSQPLPKKKD
jgi:tetratricopeptide (TPR) repeat protein/tRNA A-37 threonylcarbamoyl transferase component Bud32